MQEHTGVIYVKLLGRISVQIGSKYIPVSTDCTLYLAYKSLYPDASHIEIAQALYPFLSPVAGRSRIEACWDEAIEAMPQLLDEDSPAWCDRREIQTDVADVRVLLADALKATSATRKKVTLRRAYSMLDGGILRGHSAPWMETLRDRLLADIVHASDSALDVTDTLAVSVPVTRVCTSRGFVGRVREVNQLRAAWHRSRLVTIVGDGGMGKTRLAVEVSGGKVPLVDLATVSSSADLVDALRGTLEMRLPNAIRSESGQLQALAARLPRRIILDNAEGLDQAAVATLEQLLQLAPDCHVLVTSRRPLELAGELLIPLRPLSLRTSRRLARVLLAQRGKVAIDRRERSLSLAPGALAKSSGGSPLALEIAVGAGALPKLSQRLQELLAGLATFAASWSEDEAREVLGEIDGYDLEQLVDARLVGRAGSGRYSMLVPVREAARRLATRSDLQEDHATYFEALAHRGASEVMDAHVAELAAALDHLQATGQAERAASMAVALTPWARQSGRLDTIEGWLRQAGKAALLPRAAFEVSDALGRVLFTAGKFFEALGFLDSSLRFWEAQEDLPLVGRAAGNLGLAHRRLGDLHQAERYTQRSLEIFRLLGDPQRLPAALTNLGQVLGEAQRWDEAADIQREAIAATKRESDLSLCYINLAETLLHTRERDEALGAIHLARAANPSATEAARADVIEALLIDAPYVQLQRAWELSQKLAVVEPFWPATLVLITDRIGAITLPG